MNVEKAEQILQAAAQPAVIATMLATEARELAAYYLDMENQPKGGMWVWEEIPGKGCGKYLSHYGTRRCGMRGLSENMVANVLCHECGGK